MIDVATFGAFVRDFGLPLAILLIVLVSGARKIWMWGYRLLEEKAHHDEVVAERDKKYDEMVAEKDKRHDENDRQWRERHAAQMGETSEWKQRYFDQTKFVERNTEATERLIALVEAERNGSS